jgi:hypothetical protein
MKLGEINIFLSTDVQQFIKMHDFWKQCGIISYKIWEKV